MVLEFWNFGVASPNRELGMLQCDIKAPDSTLRLHGMDNRILKVKKLHKSEFRGIL